MRKQSLLKKIISGMTALTVAVVLMPALNAHAASEYTVTFRPGNVGQFGIASEDNADKTVKEMAQEVADIYYAQYETTVTENGAIKVKVPAGADMPAVPGYIIPDAGYCVRTWGPEQGAKVTKNVDYVADYGRLTDGVEYTVKYVDEESGESLAPFLTAYANIGDTVSVTAPASIMTSDAGEYVLTSEATQELTLVADAASNVITFNYVYSYDPGTVTENVIVTIPGDTVVTTQTNTVYVEGEPVTVPGAVVIEDDDTPLDDTPEDDDADVQGEEEQEIVDIEDEDTPLAGTVEGETTGDAEEVIVDIEDEEAPLAGVPEAEGGINTAVIVAGVFAVAAFAVFMIWLQSKRKKAEVEE